MKIVFLVEERSMKECLHGLLPRIIPSEIEWQILPHEGKTDLEKSIPRKLRGWNEPDVSFVVLRDKDKADCHVVKARLIELCEEGHRPETLIRVVCHALESWFLGDLRAVQAAFEIPVARHGNKVRFRNPDLLPDPVSELEKLVPGYGKVSGARELGTRLSLEENRSVSYRVFVAGVKRLVDTLQG